MNLFVWTRKSRYWPLYVRRYFTARHRIQNAWDHFRRRSSSPDLTPYERTYQVGAAREERVAVLLQRLKDADEIIGFVPTTHGDVSDVIRGIDFYIAVRNRIRRMFIGIQVTGQYYADEHRAQFPKVPVLIVGDDLTDDDIIGQLRQIIAEHTAH